MKILHILQFLGIGGLERVVLSLALTQKEMGHQVTIFVYDYEQTWVPYFRSLGLEVIISNKLKRPGYDTGLLKELKKISTSYDIVHTHDLNPLLYFAPLRLASRFSLKRSAKLIHTTHGLDHIKKNPKTRFYEIVATRFADKVIAVSSSIASFYLNDVALASGKVRQIDNGVKTNAKLPSTMERKVIKAKICERHKLNPELPLLVSIARVVPLKDQLFLMKAVQVIPNCQLLIVGPVDSEYEKKLIPLSSERIILTGPSSEVETYNLAADIYLSASTHEGIPVAVLEAMALETRCLVSNITGHKILNTVEKTVELFELGNQTDFSKKLIQMLNNQGPSIIQNARRAVESQYSLAAMARKYQAAYEEALC